MGRGRKKNALKKNALKKNAFKDMTRDDFAKFISYITDLGIICCEGGRIFVGDKGVYRRLTGEWIKERKIRILPDKIWVGDLINDVFVTLLTNFPFRCLRPDEMVCIPFTRGDKERFITGCVKDILDIWHDPTGRLHYVLDTVKPKISVLHDKPCKTIPRFDKSSMGGCFLDTCPAKECAVFDFLTGESNCPCEAGNTECKVCDHPLFGPFY